MHNRENNRLDRFAFALGSFAIVSPYTVFPIVPNDRIAAAWDARLGTESRKTGPGCDPARSRMGWVT